MKKFSQYPKEILLDYLDGNLDPVNRESLEKALSENLDLQKQLEALRNADLIMRQIHVDQPSKNFTASVIKRLDEYPFRAGVSIRNGILLLTGVMIVVGIAVLLLSLGVFDQTTTLNPNDITLVQRYIKQTLPSIPIDGKMLVNIIVVLNLALVFVVLDRAILKPLFQRRRMQASH